MSDNSSLKSTPFINTPNPAELFAFDLSTINPVIDGELYISNYLASKQYDVLKSLGIKQILSIGKELPEHKSSDFKTLHIKIDDSPYENIYRYFDTANNFIKQGPTLVHCYAGISRSASIIIAYLMKEKKMSLKQAVETLKKSRLVINPNVGFMEQLKDYEEYLQMPKYVFTM
jgi:protein-tyrosine phosphatase